MGADSVTLRRKRAESSRDKSSWPVSWQEISTKPGLGKGWLKVTVVSAPGSRAGTVLRPMDCPPAVQARGTAWAFRVPVFLTVAVKATGWPTAATARAAVHPWTARLETGPESSPARTARRITGGRDRWERARMEAHSAVASARQPLAWPSVMTVMKRVASLPAGSALTAA